MPRRMDEEDKPPIQFRDGFLLPLAFGFAFLLHWLADNQLNGDFAMAARAVGNVAGVIGVVMLISIVTDKSKRRGKKKIDI